MKAKFGSIVAMISLFTFAIAAQASFRTHVPLSISIPAGHVSLKANTAQALNDDFAEIHYRGNFVASMAVNNNQGAYCADLADTAQMHHQGFVLQGIGYQDGENFVFRSVTGCELQ
jgi:hypothetical protein